MTSALSLLNPSILLSDPQKGHRVGTTVLALPLLFLFELFVDLEKDAEVKVVTHDLESRNFLNKSIDQFKRLAQVLRLSVQGQEGSSLSLLLYEWVQVWISLLQLANHVLDLLQLDICEPRQATVRKHKLYVASAVNLGCFYSHLLRFQIFRRSA